MTWINCVSLLIKPQLRRICFLARGHAFDGRDAVREHWFLLGVTFGRLLQLGRGASPVFCALSREKCFLGTNPNIPENPPHTAPDLVLFPNCPLALPPVPVSLQPHQRQLPNPSKTRHFFKNIAPGFVMKGDL